MKINKGLVQTVFKIVGYEIKTPDGTYLNSCVFWVYAEKADEALKKAKLKGVEKKYYEVIEVIEK